MKQRGTHAEKERHKKDRSKERRADRQAAKQTGTEKKRHKIQIQILAGKQSDDKIYRYTEK